MNDFRKIGVVGKVTIINGDEIIIKRESNAIVRQGLRHISALLSMNGYNHAPNTPQYTYFGSYAPVISFGKGAITQTAWDTDDLINRITVNASSGTQNATAQIGSNNYYCTIYTASWNSSILNDQLIGEEKLSELGLYLNLFNSVSANWSISAGTTYPNVLFSRISLGDASFVPSSVKPVTVEWELGVEFV